MPVSTPGGGSAARGQRRSVIQDHIALAEIELCGELMIAASAAEERLSLARIDEVLSRAAGELDGVPESSR
ncbi:hypothetical protein [Streptomyces boncukensis]|uniref:ANTAR domain-containing protein n=1 Tax=Streptomyces boncukensis TaxID=2711219 RepID=A0A6G4X5R1_9ACTN|nr:hypothetical protein [Streptomyces boncukensis]NGO72593.1 hypothetical protein [Streptomyces boncukensis]